MKKIIDNLFPPKYRICVKYYYSYDKGALVKQPSYYYIERKRLFRWKFLEKVPSFLNIEGLDAATYWKGVVERRRILNKLNSFKGEPVS